MPFTTSNRVFWGFGDRSIPLGGNANRGGGLSNTNATGARRYHSPPAATRPEPTHMRTETWAGSARGGSNWETPITAGLLHLLQGSPQLPHPPAGPDRSFLWFGALAMIRYYAKPISAALQDFSPVRGNVYTRIPSANTWFHRSFRIITDHR